MKVFITGGTGLIGQRLVPRLLSRGHEVAVLTRNAASTNGRVHPDAELVEGAPCQAGSWQRILDNCDAVVSLAGENLFARRWSVEQKERLRRSRVDAARTLSTAIANVQGPKVLVSGSAIGWYGPRGDESLDESAKPGDDFLAGVCAEWETAAREPLAKREDVRVVLLRTGVVFDPRGGALLNMVRPFYAFMGGPVGNGRQFISWIHHHDLVELIRFAIEEDKLRGPVNATAPEPLPNREISAALGRAVGRPSWAPVPPAALRLVLGEVSDVIVTGQRVIPKAAQDAGFEFKFPDANAALKDLYAWPNR